MSTETIVETTPEVIPYEDEDDGKNHLTHIVNPPNNLHLWQPGMSAQDIVDLARALGTNVVALCGHTWVPKRNPEKYPVCQACMDIAGMYMREAGE